MLHDGGGGELFGGANLLFVLGFLFALEFLFVPGFLFDRGFLVGGLLVLGFLVGLDLVHGLHGLPGLLELLELLGVLILRILFRGAGGESDRGFLRDPGADRLPRFFLDDLGLWNLGPFVLFGLFGLFGLLELLGLLGCRGRSCLVAFGGEQRLEFGGLAAGLRQITLQGFDPLDEVWHRLVPSGGGAVLQPGHVDLLLVDPLLQLDHLATGLLGVADVLVDLLGAGLRLRGAGLGFGDAQVGLRDLLSRLLDLRLRLLGLDFGLEGALVGLLDPGLGLAGLGLGVVGAALRLQQPRIGFGGGGCGGRGLAGDPGDHVGVDGGLVGDGVIVEKVGLGFSCRFRLGRFRFSGDSPGRWVGGGGGPGVQRRIGREGRRDRHRLGLGLRP